MILVHGLVKEDSRRDVFWQKSFVKDDAGEIYCKILVCASQEFIAHLFRKPMKDAHIDLDVTKWFKEKTDLQYEKVNSASHDKEIETLFDIYPKTAGMLEFAYTVK